MSLLTYSILYTIPWYVRYGMVPHLKINTFQKVSDLPISTRTLTVRIAY